MTPSKLFVVSMLGSLLLVASNPAVYHASGIFASETIEATNITFSLYQDLQTFMGASATCQTAQQSFLASIVSADEMAAVSNLAVEFWNSSVASEYLSAPHTPPANPGTPGSLGFVNQSLFQGCVWIGMSNLNHPGLGTYLSNMNSTASLGFQDSALMSDYILNMRSGSQQSPVQLSGWSFYNTPLPVTSTGSGIDKSATCAMLCPQPSSLQLSHGYSTIVLASCTNIALPYICKSSEPVSLTPADDHSPAEHSPAEHLPAPHRRLSSSAAAPADSTGSSEAAAVSVTYTQVLGLAVSEHGAAWPVAADPVNTSLPGGSGVNQAKCYPGGLYDYCVFPESVKRTQADWMFICWDAGLEPLDINNYAALVTVMAMQPSTPGWPGAVQLVHTQSFQSSNSPAPVNLYSKTTFLADYMASHEALPLPNLPQRNLSIPLYNSTSPPKQPQPGWPYINTPNSTCGPDGFGFGCSIAVAFSNNKAVGLTTVSANLLANGICQRHSHQPSPRPSTGAVPVVKLAIMFEFEDGNVTANQITDDASAAADAHARSLSSSAASASTAAAAPNLFREEFLTKLSKEAVPSALPGVAAADVQIPTGPVAVFLEVPEDQASSNQTLKSALGVMLFITLPYTVNTTTLINAYLTNIINHPTSVLPAEFLEEYHIGPGTISVLSSISGNINVDSSSSSNSLAVSLGVGIGVGLPLFCLAVFGVYKFYKDANPAKKEKGDV